MNKKTFHSCIGASLLAVSGFSFWQMQEEKLTTTIEENIAYTLKDPCAKKEKTDYLNCRLHETRWTRNQNDAETREIISRARHNLNFFLSSTLSLPVEVREKTIGRTPDGRLLTESYATPSFLPQTLNTRFWPWSVSITYKTQFDLEKLLQSKTWAFPPPVLSPPSAIALWD